MGDKGRQEGQGQEQAAARPEAEGRREADPGEKTPRKMP